MIPFRAKKHRHEGMVFDSTAELARWQELRLLERAGEIYDLQHHPKFELIVNGEKIAVYTADSGYYRKGVQGRVTLFDYKPYQRLLSRRERDIARYAEARLHHRPSKKIAKRLQHATTKLLLIENGQAA